MSKIKAGTLIVKKIKNGTSTNILAFGKRYKYEPNTPAIAPDAPIIGISEFIFNKACEKQAKMPLTK